VRQTGAVAGLIAVDCDEQDPAVGCLPDPRAWAAVRKLVGGEVLERAEHGLAVANDDRATPDRLEHVPPGWSERQQHRDVRTLWCFRGQEPRLGAACDEHRSVRWNRLVAAADVLS